MVNLRDHTWRQGYRDYVRGAKVYHCPYTKGSPAWDLWISGHSAAQFNSER